MLHHGFTLGIALLTSFVNAPPMHTDAGEVTFKLEVIVTVPTKTLQTQDRKFLDGMRTDLGTVVRQGTGTQDLAGTAAQRMASYSRYPVLLGRSTEPAAADVNVSFSLTIKVDVQKLNTQDASFLAELEREAKAMVTRGVTEEQLRGFVQERLTQYAAQLKSSGSTSALGDQTNVTIGFTITVKF